MCRHPSHPRFRVAAAAALALSLCVLGSSCAPRSVLEGPAPSLEGPAPSGPLPDHAEPAPAPRTEEAPEPEVYTASRSFLIYSVQWGKAEDLALTLEPVILARYGPAARVVPHVPTNKLFIYLPSPSEQEAARGTGGVPGAQGVPTQRVPSQGVPAAGRRATTGNRIR